MKRLYSKQVWFPDILNYRHSFAISFTLNPLSSKLFQNQTLCQFARNPSGYLYRNKQAMFSIEGILVQRESSSEGLFVQEQAGYVQYRGDFGVEGVQFRGVICIGTSRLCSVQRGFWYRGSPVPTGFTVLVIFFSGKIPFKTGWILKRVGFLDENALFKILDDYKCQWLAQYAWKNEWQCCIFFIVQLYFELSHLDSHTCTSNLPY